LVHSGCEQQHFELQVGQCHGVPLNDELEAASVSMPRCTARQ